MSATGRGAIISPLEFYETPAWAVQVLLRNVYLPTRRWLDPCAGTGAISHAADAANGGDSIDWTLVEIAATRAARAGAICADFFDYLREQRRGPFDVAIFNPPFTLAEEFVRACLPIADHVVCLQRINWAAKRGKLFDEHPADVYVLPDRPAFGLNSSGKVGTDSIEYAWFHFHRESIGKFRVLPRVPKSEIKAANARIRAMAATP